MRVLAALILLGASIFASNSWYDQKLEGWYYFEEKPAGNKDSQEKLTPKAAQNIVESEKALLQQLLSLALVQPTEQNVQNYMQRQKAWIEQSGQFAATWGQVLLQNPLLGDFLTNPTTSYGIQAKKHLELETKKALLKTLSKDHFLVFFFKGSDYYSAQAARVVKLFADMNQWNVKAVSLDGVGVQEFPDFEIDKGLSQTFAVKAAPSMFVVDPYSDQAIPVGAGLISVSQLEEQIVAQIKQETP